MIRIGIIGCGGISRTHAVSVAAFPSRATVVAAADTDAARRTAFAQEFGVRPYACAEDLLDLADVDCVLIALPHPPLAPQLNMVRFDAHALASATIVLVGTPVISEAHPGVFGVLSLSPRMLFLKSSNPTLWVAT